MRKAKFTIPGIPKGKGRQRSRKDGSHPYTPKDTVLYENKVTTCYMEQCGMFFEKGMPLDMRITAYLPIPSSESQKRQRLMEEHKIRPTKKPDSSNIQKAVEDGLNGVAYSDDSQIVDTQVRRFYSHQPRVVVTIQEARCE